jgi:LmbE family N-acetylglucosaminyl deacetylase
MLPLNLPGLNRPLRLLCLGAHADDIEIGCGGLVLSLIREQRALDVTWVVFSGTPERRAEARRGASLFLAKAAGKRVMLHKFKDGFFPFDPGVKEAFEALKKTSPDIVLTHYRDDRHQDHRMLSDLAWNTFRDQIILEYEIPKWDGDLGVPNCFVPLDEKVAALKVSYLEQAFGSQRNKDWFSEETFRGLMRLRGMECRAPDGYAEAFYSRKLLLSTMA